MNQDVLVLFTTIAQAFELGDFLLPFYVVAQLGHRRYNMEILTLILLFAMATPMTADQLRDFIKHNEFPITVDNLLARCVDGRYQGLDPFPSIAKPGADAGDIMSLFATLNGLGVTVPHQTVLDVAVETLGGPQHFRFHTDDHAEHDHLEAGMGCGHLKLARQNPESYGVTSEQMEFLFAALPQLMAAGAKQEVLHGNHGEQAVVVVDSATHGLMPHDCGENCNDEAFVYEKTLHEQELEKLAHAFLPIVTEAGSGVNEMEFLAALKTSVNAQMSETLKRLAGGLPVYTAHVDDAGEVVID